jgi:hypothetical protein
MYSDPTKIRSHVTKIRLSDDEHKLIDAFVNYTGEQKAVLLRELILEAAASSLGVYSGRVQQSVEVPQGVFQSAC